MGSILPVPCPSWGLCAGRAYDTDNPAQGLEPGSQPVVVPGGQQVVQQSVQQSLVQQEVEVLASDSGAVNETAFLLHMASQYGVPLEAISLELTKQEQALLEWENAIEEEGEQRRQLTAHSERALQATTNVRLTYTLRIDPNHPSINNNMSASDLTASLQAASTGIASSLSSVLGLNVTQARAAAVSTTTQVVQVMQDCQPGFWGSGALCLACTPGKFDLGGTTTACAQCEGAFQPNEAGTACHTCVSGSYCPAGAVAALPCPSGRYGSATNLSTEDQCASCPPGTSCTTGATAPLACAAGSIQAEEGRSSCEYCSPGSFQPSKGNVTCDTCPSRTYASISGAAECNNCLPRLSSFPGSTSCDVCDEGFYRRDAETVATPEECVGCPEKGATCSIDTTLETIEVLPGA